MLKLKLEALGHPTPNNIAFSNRKEFASTVLWLEDQTIRLYPIEGRDTMRNLEDMPAWEEGYKQYCTDLSMPPFETQLEQLTWLVGNAMRLEFLDNPSQYESINGVTEGQPKNNGAQSQEKVQTIFDVHDKDFIAGVRTLATKLQVPHHPNHLLQLQAITRIVHERIGPASMNRKAITGTPFPFDKGNDVVAANDPALDYPMRILRLLQIQSLRQLQTHINETIVAVQSLTANPKTDTKLGKVGR
ncbi:RNA transcription, translation and transport factor protein isoform X2 [Drosophila grimshawi]|uniref:RNA transcription, translation and transport factor protein isoform X2 n=1 Tax=Drosophila grimshawi TaxID=7222 RepID=UPI000C870BF8|nr:RNA transcription, translation and transport factor protein isoform X2 [Drosophila grimshawi]